METLLILLLFLLPPLIVAIFIGIIRKKQYEKTDYYRQTHLSYISVLHDKGRLGEYYTYKCLTALNGYARYLFNLYIPKGNGETTELDIVLLHESGIYVFESKNYSGWIFGTESQSYWTQTLPVGRKRTQKSRFYNPILQNKGHIKWLQTFLHNQQLPFFSYIVFSDRCTLKSITLTSDNHKVVNRYNLFAMIQQNVAKSGTQLSTEQIDELFASLYPLTQINEAQKTAHINNINQITHLASRSVSSAAERQSIEETCPRCGGKLVVRVVSKGDRKGTRFLGCSNYPQCKYIKSIPDKHDK